MSTAYTEPIPIRRPRQPRPPEDLSTDAQQRMCPSCTLRWIMGAPKREIPSEIRMDPITVQTLEAAARDFDDLADDAPDEHYSAVDFIDWIKPDLTYRRTKASE